MDRVVNVFVANRGEIASRLARGLRGLGHRSVGLYTPEDACWSHRWLLDACLPAPTKAGYMDGDAMLALARAHNCEAVHPGYGFLSQEPAFAQAVVQAGMRFVGPSPTAMRALGDKAAARARAERLGVPVGRGMAGVRTLVDAQRCAATLGFPLLFKAPNAGGGRGLVRAEQSAELGEALASAQRVAGPNQALVVERFLPHVRHIEVQVAADGRRAMALGTRDCTSQRRLQKVIEQAPAIGMPDGVSEAMAQAAEQLFADAAYQGVGTAEFLLTPKGEFFFLEVNPRLQVEHPVTEMVYGIDLLAWQLQLAFGEALPNNRPVPFGVALEARINAEDPACGFAPQQGVIGHLAWPAGPGIRVDAGVAEQSEVGTRYDPLLAKIIAWAPTRPQACRRLAAALNETVVLGVGTNLAYLHSLLRHPAFLADDLHTRWLDDVPFAPPPIPAFVADGLQGAPFSIAGLGRAEAALSAPVAHPFAQADSFGRARCGQ